MHYSVYILYSKKLNRFYVGETKHLEIRLVQHNKGESQYTSVGIPWTLIWSTSKPTRFAAKTLEQKIKHLSRIRKVNFILKYEEGIRNIDLTEEIKCRVK